MKTRKKEEVEDLVTHAVDALAYIGASSLNDHYGDSVPSYNSLGPFKFYNGQITGICIKCKQYTNISMVYQPYKDVREVCKECTTDMFDKLLGIDNSTEKLLYSKPK